MSTNNNNTFPYPIFIFVHPTRSFQRQHWNNMKRLFPTYPESWFCPQPLVPVCVIAIHYLSYENAHGINPNLSQWLSSNCMLFCPLCEKKRILMHQQIKGFHSALAYVCTLYSLFSPIAAIQIISLCLACVSLIRQKHGEPYVNPFNTLEPQTKHVFGQDLGLDGDGCTARPVCRWIKTRWHRGRRLQTYLSNRDLIHACTETHCGIRDYRPPPVPSSPFPLLLCHADSIACATMCYPLQMKN